MLQVRLLLGVAQTDQQVLGLTLHLQQTHILKNIQTDQHLTQLQIAAGPANDFAAQAGRGFPDAVAAAGGQVPPHGGQGGPLRQQGRGFRRGQIIAVESAVTAVFNAGPGLAAGPDVHDVQLHAAFAPKFVDLGLEGHIHHVTGLDGGAFRGGGEADGVQGVMSLPQPQPHMAAAPDEADPVNGHVFQHQHRLGTAVAAGLQGLQRVDAPDGQQLGGHGAVNIQHGPGTVVGIIFSGNLADGLPEGRDLIPMDGKAGRQFVTAVAFQQMGKTGQAGEQVEAAIAAGAGLAVLAVQADQEGGAAVFFRDAAGHDAHHTLVPAFVCQHDGLRLLAGRQHADGLLENFRFHGLALPVQFAQGLGQLGRFPVILRQKQADGQLDLADATGGVDPGGQNKADGGSGHRGRVAVAFGHQCHDAGPMAIAQGIQTLGHKHPVFAHQGHHVGHGAQADHVRIVPQYRFLAAAKGSGQLEGHTHAAEVIMGIAAVRPMGIHHRGGFRQGILAFVVIGDHQIDAQILAHPGFLDGGDTTVHGDDQLDAFCVELVNGDGVEAVAFLQPAGDVTDHVGTLMAQKIRQKAGGGDAVHVIIAENGDLFAPGQSKTHPGNSFVHVMHQKGVRHLAIAAKMLLGARRIFEATG